MGKRRASRKSGKRTALNRTFRLSRRTALLIVAAVAFAAYWNTLGHGFVFDDVTLIEQNPQVSELRWGEIVGRSGYRPVRTLTYALNYWVGGLNPFGYHLANMLLHVANSALVFLLLGRLGLSRRGALAGGLLFALHPVQTAAVAYISGRKDLLATLFTLLGLQAHLRYRQSRRALHLAAVLACFALAVLSKEVAIVFPVLLLLVETHLRERAARAAGEPARGFARAAGRTLAAMPGLYGLATALAGVASFYALRVVGASRMDGFWGGDALSNLATSFRLFAHYLRLFVFPHPLIADYTGDVFPVPRGFAEPATLLAAALAAGFAATAVWAFRREPRLTLGMMWFATALLPVLQIIPFHELAADHFLYLPLFGGCLVAGTGFHKLVSRRRWRNPAWIGLGALALGAFLLTTARNRDWRSDEALWDATYRQAPGSYRANLNRGFYQYRRGNWDEAVRLTRRSIALKPTETLGYSNLGSFYRERGSQEIQRGNLQAGEEFERQARQLFEKALSLNENDIFALSNLGDVEKDMALIAEKRGRSERALASRKAAIQWYETALARAADHPVEDFLWFKIGMVFVDHGACDMALQVLRRVVDRKPNFDLLQYWTGFCAFQIGAYRESARQFERTLRLTESEEAYSLLGASYERLGRSGDAMETYRRGLRRFPDVVEFHHNLGVLLYQSGKPLEAAGHLRRALELAPRGPLAPRIRDMLEKLPPRS